MKESVLAVLFFGEEVLVIKRQNALPVFPGYFSFPGGKVESIDTTHAQQNQVQLKASCSPLIPPSILHAIIRELQEELHFNLVENDQNGQVESIVSLGLAITPDFNPHRFKNYYVGVILKSRPSFIYDNNEIEWGRWQTAGQWMELYHKGDMLIVPPMRSLLEFVKTQGLKKINELVHLTNPAELPNFELSYDSECCVPCIEPLSGVLQFLPLSQTFPPANRTNCFLIGDDQKYLIDPSPKDEAEFKKLVTTLEPHTITGLFITHHHPDHHQFAPNLARLRQLPIFLSEDTKSRIEHYWGQDYFSGIKIHFCRHGDVLTQYKKSDVMIYSTPGHDRGQLGLMPVSKKWFLVGDLIQSVGTVLIGAPEGDMVEYFQSLQKVIDLQPAVILPSHGIGLGGVIRLQETLRHRKMREEQIKNFLQQGMSLQDILMQIYKDIDPKLHKYALKTIEAHIKKIEMEK